MVKIYEIEMCFKLSTIDSMLRLIRRLYNFVSVIMEPGLHSHILLISSIMLESTDQCTCTLHPASILMTYQCTLESGETQVVVHPDKAQAYVYNNLDSHSAVTGLKSNLC
jgi:hypothetical protein